MKCKIEDGVLVVETESVSETEELKLWRSRWRAKPKKEIWFKCNYYNPVQVIVI